MKNKIIIPKSIFDFDLTIAKDAINTILDYGKLNNANKKSFLENVKSRTKQIVYSSSKTNRQKLDELFNYKRDLEFQRVNAYEYQVKQINQAIQESILPAINNLLDQLEIEKKYGSLENNNPEKNPLTKNEDVRNDFIRTNSETSKEQENEIQNEHELKSNNSEYIGMNSDKNATFAVPKIRANKDNLEIFKRLSSFKNELNNQPYLTEADVEQLLLQSIIGYAATTPIPKKEIKLNLSNKQYGLIYTFIYKFYLKNETRHTGVKRKYALFLRDNFSCFKNFDLDTLYSSIRNHQRFEKMEILNF